IRFDWLMTKVIGVFLIVRCELIWIASWRDQMFHRLTIVATAQRRTTFARATCYHHREARIVRTRPKHSLAESRHTEDRYVLCVDAFVCFQVSKRATQSPRPRGNRTPFVRRRLLLSWLEI